MSVFSYQWQKFTILLYRYYSLQAEAKRFLGALSKKAEMKGSELFAIEELFDIADTLELNVPDLTAFIDQLNEAGWQALKKTSVLTQQIGLNCPQ